MRVNILFLLIIIGAACTVQPVNKQGLISYLEDEANGVSKSITKGKFKIHTSYRPFELIWYNDPEALAAEETKRYEYFILKISRDNQDPTNILAGTDDYTKANQYLNELTRDVRLVTTLDTISPVESMAMPMYGTTPEASVLLAFETELRNTSGSVHLIFNDSQFKTGKSLFEFNAKDFKNIPTLIPTAK